MELSEARLIKLKNCNDKWGIQNSGWATSIRARSLLTSLESNIWVNMKLEFVSLPNKSRSIGGNWTHWKSRNASSLAMTTRCQWCLRKSSSSTGTCALRLMKSVFWKTNCNPKDCNSITSNEAAARANTRSPKSLKSTAWKSVPMKVEFRNSFLRKKPYRGKFTSLKAEIEK